MIRVAIIGAGHIGEVHATAISNLDNAKVVAVTDNIVSKGKKFAEKFKIEFYKNLEDILNNKEIDVIAICTPSFLHTEIAIKAANAKKNIFCEKPLALNNNDAQRMVKAVEENNVKSMTAHVLRFWPAYTKVKEIIDSRKLGNALHIYCERLMPIPPTTEGKWNKEENFSGGAAIEIQIHDIDYILWLFGEPEKIKSSGIYDPNYAGWCHINTSLEFKNGRTALEQVGWRFPGNFPFTNVIRVVCEFGTIEWISRVDMDHHLDSFNKSEIPPVLIYKNDSTLEKEFLDDTDAFVNEWKYFISILQSGKENEKSDFKNGAASLKIVLATIDSIKKFETIKL